MHFPQTFALSPLQWTLLALAACCSGLAKTGISGLGILAVPIFALCLPAKESVGTVLLVLICADVLAVLTYRRQANVRQLVALLPWTLAGIVAGFFTLGKLDDISVRRLIGGILLALVAFALWRRARASRESADLVLPPWAAPLAGIVAGFTTMVANAAGPVMVLYLLAMRLDKLAFLGTSAWFFFCVNWLKVPFGIRSGLIHPQSLATAVCLFPAAIFGGLIGRRLATSIDQKLFETLALALTGVSSLWFLLGDRIVTLFAR